MRRITNSLGDSLAQQFEELVECYEHENRSNALREVIRIVCLTRTKSRWIVRQVFLADFILGSWPLLPDFPF